MRSRRRLKSFGHRCVESLDEEAESFPPCSVSESVPLIGVSTWLKEKSSHSTWKTPRAPQQIFTANRCLVSFKTHWYDQEINGPAKTLFDIKKIIDRTWTDYAGDFSCWFTEIKRRKSFSTGALLFNQKLASIGTSKIVVLNKNNVVRSGSTLIFTESQRIEEMSKTCPMKNQNNDPSAK